MRHPVRLDEGADLPNYLIRTTDEEAVRHQLVEISRDRGIDERVPPAARVLAPIGDHDVLFGELARLLVALRNDQIARERPLGDRLRMSCRAPVCEKLLLASEQ